ncbi:MAG: ABC transporter permease [Bacteroidales bacterium]|jgi:putative ABC transport system permease protein|nr:ABC transporter permease [Bacteroidales bacterium]
MTASNLIRIAWNAIALNKMRTFLTMLGIIIGVGSVITMLSIGEGSKQGIREQISTMGTNMITIRPGAQNIGGVRMDNSSQRFTIADVNALEEESTLLSFISPMVSSNGQAINGANNWPTQITGVFSDYMHIRKLSLSTGSMFDDSYEGLNSKVCILGQTVVNNLFNAGENPIGKTIRFKNIPLQVIGILEPKGENAAGQDQDNLMLAPFFTVQKRILGITYISSIVASAVSEEQSPEAVEETRTIIRQSQKLRPNDADNFRIFSMEELIQTSSTTSEMLTVLLVVIAGISLLIGGIGIMNIMYVSVKERTREIGLRMAVGGKSSDILLQFLTEAIFISFSGGLIGVILGLTSSFLVSHFLQWPIVITTYSIVISFLVCVVTGVFFGWYPARKASNLDPIEALRYE